MIIRTTLPNNCDKKTKDKFFRPWSEFWISWLGSIFLVSFIGYSSNNWFIDNHNNLSNWSSMSKCSWKSLHNILNNHFINISTIWYSNLYGSIPYYRKLVNAIKILLCTALYRSIMFCRKNLFYYHVYRLKDIFWYWIWIFIIIKRINYYNGVNFYQQQFVLVYSHLKYIQHGYSIQCFIIFSILFWITSFLCLFFHYSGIIIKNETFNQYSSITKSKNNKSYKCTINQFSYDWKKNSNFLFSFD